MNNRKILSILIVLVGIVVIVIMAIMFLGKGNKSNSGGKQITNTTNYELTTDGNKVNTSTEVTADKKVGEILLEKSQITYVDGISKLTSKVTNDSVSRSNLRFKVKFISNDGSVIAESVGFVGSIKANETKYIDSYITLDVSNAKDIKYELMD